MNSKTAMAIGSFYGVDALVYVIESFQKGTSTAEVARTVGVTRQAAHRWKQKLGYEERVWEPDTTVLNAVDTLKRELESEE